MSATYTLYFAERVDIKHLLFKVFFDLVVQFHLSGAHRVLKTTGKENAYINAKTNHPMPLSLWCLDYHPQKF